MSSDKDPWSGRNKKPDQPPNLDELFNKLRRQIIAAFGGKKSGQGGNFPASPKNGGKFGIGLITLLIVAIWILSGVFIVSPAEESVILLFGKYNETLGPGLHWVPRFIESTYTVNVQQVSTYPYQSEMLTKDENIVSVAVAVQYRVTNPKNYLFNVVNPEGSLQQATAAALRQVVGQTSLDDILTTGRAKVRDEVAVQLSNILKGYHVGIMVMDVTLQPAKPPEQVTAAFDDAIKAREDEQRYINKANAYAQKVVPIAKGQAARIFQEAEAYQKQVVLEAKAAIAGYLAILPEYKKAPEVTRERLYITAIESVLDKSSKILIDVKGGNNVMYLPLNNLLREQPKTTVKNIVSTTPEVNTDTTELPPPVADDNTRPSYPLSRYYPSEAQ